MYILLRRFENTFLTFLLPFINKFLATAVINQHKLSGFKQQKFVLSEFWRQEV